MGSESSILEECVLDDEVVQIKEWAFSNGLWKKRNTSFQNFVKVTVVQRKLSQNFSKRDAECYQNAVRCLKVYRHPCIVKYYDSGERGETVFLITERVQPLSRVLLKLTPLEICAGLNNVLQALVFCHETCQVRHNNFGLESVFVTPDGTWKLAGMEFLCKQADLTEQFLQKNRAFRNESLIPPEEKEGRFNHLRAHGHAGDVYAFGLFAKDLLELVLKTESLPNAKELMDVVKKELLITDPTLRPSLKTFLFNKFFQNDFLEIVTFLRHITLKESAEKEDFFRVLAPKLFRLPEELVAHHLTEMLLSRLVLLDASANEFFLPHFLRPCREAARRTEYIEDQVNPILTESLFKEYIIPHLTYIFEVLDVNIRTVLLTYFEYYADLFDNDVLSEKILPHILLGIRDTNNSLVAISLRALATLVPLLGGETVIGGKRNQYFIETKPKERLAPDLHTKPVDRNVDSIITKSDVSIISPTHSPITKDDELKKVDVDIAETEVVSLLQEESPVRDHRSDDCQPQENQISSDTSSVSDIVDCQDEEDWSDWEGLSDVREPPNGADVVDEYRSPPLCNHKDPSLPLNGDLEVVQTVSRFKKADGSQLGLGEEYDVMAIKVVPGIANEVNFFDGMQPVISTFVKPVYVPVNKCDGVDERNSDEETGYSFEVAESEVIPNGWGEDLDWDELR